ncbi:MAG TPA: dienelactone hydrolase family protein [Terracidiphilus sp.]|nr:dienelactone hydrolase family protein [Terracidiphilus sp.]
MKLFRLLLCTAVVFLAAGLAARAQQPITFPSGDGTAQGFLYLPQGAGPHPALVVIQEWWGVNDWIKQQAADYASKGYVALAVDLYRGKVADNPETAHELMRGLPQDQGVRDLTSAVTFLESRKDVKRDRIGAVGWCMGGGYALQLAIAAPSLKAVAINYGALATDKSQLAKVRAAVLGNFGGKDQGIPPDAVNAFEATMKSLGRPVDAKIYPDAGHAFENPNNKGGYRAGDAADALGRIDRFFADQLGH